MSGPLYVTVTRYDGYGTLEDTETVPASSTAAALAAVMIREGHDKFASEVGILTDRDVPIDADGLWRLETLFAELRDTMTNGLQMQWKAEVAE